MKKEVIIENAVKSFIGTRLSELTPEMILNRIKSDLNDQNFKEKVTINGNIVAVGTQVINTKVVV